MPETYVKMPESDYVDICDTVRFLAGTEEPLTSVDVIDALGVADGLWNHVEDGGKVVPNGPLVGLITQTNRIITENGTYDTTTNNAISVRVQAAGGGEWVRPSDWPDIDALADLEDGERDCLYLTYDLRRTPGYGWIGLYGKTANSTAWTLERGHISGGAFVADETHTVNSNAKYRQALDETAGNVQLWRVTSSGHLTDFGFVTDTATQASAMQNVLQPCVQRAGYLPWRGNVPIGIGSFDSQIANSTVWLERDAAVLGSKAAATSLRGYWANCYNLQSVDVSKWATSLWAVTDIRDMCLDCAALRSIDFRNLDKSGWLVQYASQTFQMCGNLHTLRGFSDIPTSTDLNSVNFLQSNFDLQDFDGFRFRASTNISVCWDLTPDSLVAILTALPEVSTSQTFTLGQANKLKLSAAQIAIATEKGWTVA